MKKLLILCAVAALSFTSCERGEVENLFDATPEERMQERLTELQSTLTGAANGWKGVLTTSLGGGYAFYFDFRDDNTVAMLADVNSGSAGTIRESTYRTKWQMNASLIFDTYNYIALLQDPGVKVPGAGGTASNGLRSDIEFEYIRMSADSVILKGKRYKNELVLTPLTAAEKASYVNDFGTLYASHKSFLDDIPNAYIEASGITSNKIAFFANTTTKKVQFQYIDNQGEVKSFEGKFGIDLTGITIIGGLDIGGGITLVKGNFEGSTFTFIDTEGRQYVMKLNDTPIIPLELLFNYNGTYRGIGTLSDVLPAIATTSDFTDVWNTVKANLLAANGRTIRYYEFVMSNSSTMAFNLYYASGTSNFTASVSFNYTYEDGYITLSNISGHTSGNWNSRRAQIAPLENYLLDIVNNNIRLKVEWVPTSDGSQVGGFILENNPNSFIYGLVK